MRGMNAAGFFAVAAFALVTGCAAPGAPVTREPRVPRAITDLSARQSGDSVLLSFKMPSEMVQGRKLSRTPAIEIYRALITAQASGEAAEQPPQLEVTIPPQMTRNYVADGEIRFADALTPAELAAHSGGEAVYMTRTRLGRHESADSNVVRVRIFPAPKAIEDLHAQITKTAVELTWTAPAIPGEGATAAKKILYRVYREEANAGNSTAKNDATKTATAEPILLGEVLTPDYSDTKFEFGRTYAYSVRSVAVYEAGSVESAGSNAVDVTPQDTFAPAAPTGLVAVAAPASGGVAAHVDLSWAISGESDLQGYNIYRRESEDGSWARLNAEPVMTPVFRDDSVEAGKNYLYRVTAVDRTGNESAASAVVSVTVPVSREANP